MLNLQGEKMCEHTFYNAILEASDVWSRRSRVHLVDYCCTESGLLPAHEGAAPHYMVFVELEAGGALGEEQHKQVRIKQ